MSFWVQHGLHLALVAVPSSAMGAGLVMERRKGQRQRANAGSVTAARPGATITSIHRSTMVMAGPRPPLPRLATRTVDDMVNHPRIALQHPLALPIVAVAAAGAALVHLVVMPEHFGESALYGMFFLTAAILQMLWAAVVTYRPSREVLLAGGLGCAATILLWLVSRTVGIPTAVGGLDGGSPETFGALDMLATVFEAVAVAGVAVALRAPNLLGGTPAAWPRSAKLIAVGALCGTAAMAFWAPVS